MCDLSANWNNSYRELEQRILSMEQKLDELSRCFQQTSELLFHVLRHRNPEIRWHGFILQRHSSLVFSPAVFMEGRRQLLSTQSCSRLLTCWTTWRTGIPTKDLIFWPCADCTAQWLIAVKLYRQKKPSSLLLSGRITVHLEKSIIFRKVNTVNKSQTKTAERFYTTVCPLF